MMCLRDNRAHEIAPFSYRPVPRAVERLRVATRASDQCHLDAGHTRAPGHSDRFTQSDGNFCAVADAHVHTDA